MAAPDFTYRAVITRWVDGDTVDVVVDLGFHIHTTQRLRLHGINAPERGRPLAAEATARAVTLAPLASLAVVRTYKTLDKYGRYLAHVYGVDSERSVNDLLIEAGLATIYFGGPKKVA